MEPSVLCGFEIKCYDPGACANLDAPRLLLCDYCSKKKNYNKRIGVSCAAESTNCNVGARGGHLGVVEFSGVCERTTTECFSVAIGALPHINTSVCESLWGGREGGGGARSK